MFHSPWMYRERKRRSGFEEVQHNRPSDTDQRAAMSAGGGGSMIEHSSPVNDSAARSGDSSSSESRDLDRSDRVNDSATESTGVVGSVIESREITPNSHVARPEDFKRNSSRESGTDTRFQPSPLLYNSTVLNVCGSLSGSDLTDGSRPSVRGINSYPESAAHAPDTLHSSCTIGQQSGNVGLSNSWSGNTQIVTLPTRLDFDDEDDMGNTHWSHSYTGVRQPVFMRSSCRSNRAQLSEDLNDIYVPIIGYEMMEQRARFTVFKLHVQKNTKESWFIFRRYTDFVRLNEQLQYLFPNFRLALPPKKWFGNNFDPMFLEDRQLGLQAFLNNICGHKDIVVSDCVREFLCVDDPPGPHDSIEESRALCESLEETIHSLKRDLSEKDRKIETLMEELSNANRRLEEVNLQQIIPNDRVLPVSSSGSETTDIDRRSCAEADQQDYSPEQEERPIVASISCTDEKPEPVPEKTIAEEPTAFTAIPLDSPVSDVKEAAVITQSDIIEVT